MIVYFNRNYQLVTDLLNLVQINTKVFLRKVRIFRSFTVFVNYPTNNIKRSFSAEMNIIIYRHNRVF